MVVDRAGQVHIAGWFVGPSFDVSGGVAPLTRSESHPTLYAVTLGPGGAPQCSRASTGTGWSLLGATTATSSHEWLVGGSGSRDLDFGAGTVGDAYSHASHVFVQRFSLEE
jgi:hypothetical protein